MPKGYVILIFPPYKQQYWYGSISDWVRIFVVDKVF